MEITVAPELEKYVVSKVASGRFTSPSQVIEAGLEALREREDMVEHWLTDEVVPALNEFDADPSQGLPIDIAFAEIRARHTLRTKSRT